MNDRDDQDATGGEAPAWLRPHGRGWTSGPAERVLDNAWIAVDDYDATAPTGAPARYHVVRFKNLAVGVVALHDDGTLAMVGQWRFPFGAYSWELPEGGVPKTELPLHGAQRELREEAGLLAADWREILRMDFSNASTDESCVCYLATGLSSTELEPDPTEALALERVPFMQVLAAVTSGKITDAMTVASVLRLHHMAMTGQLPEALARAALGQTPTSAL